MSKIITCEEVIKHNNKDSVWLVIRNDVYDVTKYLEEHPGGEEVLLEVAGQEATQAFDDVGHSDDAKEVMRKYKIGSLPLGEKMPANLPKLDPSSNNKWKYLIALASVVLIGIALKKYMTPQ